MPLQRNGRFSVMNGGSGRTIRNGMRKQKNMIMGGTRSGNEGDDHPKTDFQALDSGQEASGILEVLADGYGFIRSDNFLPGENDVYVSPSQIRRFGLKTGDILRGNTRIKSQNENFPLCCM